MTTIGTVAFAPQIGSAGQSGSPGPALLGASAGQTAARDAQIADLPATAASVNQLQSLASTSLSATPAPALPTTQQQTQAQQNAAQPPLNQDFYADGDDAG